MGWDARRAEAMAAMIDGERAIELRVNVDADAGVAAPIPARVELDEPASELDGVVMADRARILEAADAVEHLTRGCRAPRPRGMRGACAKRAL